MEATAGRLSSRRRLRRPQSILFGCTHNSVRSPMAAALGRHFFGRAIYFASAGVHCCEIDAFAVAVMDEIGIDISGHTPSSFADLDDTSFDLIVTLSPEAHHTALALTRMLATQVVYWPTLDPTAVQGTRETILAAYRGVRDSLQKRLEELLDWHPMGSV